MTRSNGGPGSDDDGDSGVPGSRRLKRLAASSGSHAGHAYQGAVEAVLAIVVATGLGYWADTRFGTSPRWLIVGAVIGFGAFVLRLARMARLIEEPARPGDGTDHEAGTTGRDGVVERHEDRGDGPGDDPTRATRATRDRRRTTDGSER